MMFTGNKKAFSLIELLVVISIIALLVSILMPALAVARSQGRSMLCRTNLRQLVLANIGYTMENNDFCVPAAEDMWNNSGYHRWHGVRDSLDEPFDPFRGPMMDYLADGKIKECPEITKFIKGLDWNTNFEQGCGGYGYNMTYLGSRFGQNGISFQESYKLTASISVVRKAAETLMLADCAMANAGENIIEYSFAEPPFTVYNSQPVTSFYMSPSIHFRHRGYANIGWVDGHVDGQEMACFDNDNAYSVNSTDMKLGWLEPINNTLFDLQ